MAAVRRRDGLDAVPPRTAVGVDAGGLRRDVASAEFVARRRVVDGHVRGVRVLRAVRIPPLAPRRCMRRRRRRVRRGGGQRQSAAGLGGRLP